MFLDVIIRRNISFVGCIMIIPATALSKISRSLSMALQWRRRCISSSILFDSHLVHIRWFIGVIGLLYRPLSILKSCELILYLAIAVMRWFLFMFNMYGSTHKDFFNNEYVRSLLELSISCLHNVLPMCCVSQAWSSPVSSRTDRIPG